MSLLYSANCFALPDNFEIWFISALDIKKTTLNPLLDPGMKRSKLMAQNYKCIPMGDNCFDPQIGLYKKDGMGKEGLEAAPEIEEIANEKNSIPTASSLDRNLIDCEKEENMFDIYCGKAGADQVGHSKKYQIWIDTSSSMRKIDDNNMKNTCRRKLFVENLRTNCPDVKDLDFYVFDTRKKQLGGIDDVCLNVGLNDSKRMIEWIKKSEVKNLVIITDIYELDVDLTNFVLANGGSLKGHKNGEELDADSMLSLVAEVAKSCKKK